LCSDETVLGSRIVELLRSTPLDPVEDSEGEASSSSSSAAGGGNGAGPQQQQEGQVLTAGQAGFRGSGAGASGAAAFQRRRTGLAASSSGSSSGKAAAGAAAAGGGGEAAAREALGPEITADADLVQLAEVVMGKVTEWDFLPGSKARSKAQRVRQQLLDPSQRQRLEAIRRYTAARPGDGTPFPPPPAAAQAPAAVDASDQGLDGFRPPSPTVLTL
jgi:hypothetical protein